MHEWNAADRPDLQRAERERERENSRTTFLPRFLAWLFSQMEAGNFLSLFLRPSSHPAEHGRKLAMGELLPRRRISISQLKSETGKVRIESFPCVIPICPTFSVSASWFQKPTFSQAFIKNQADSGNLAIVVAESLPHKRICTSELKSRDGKAGKVKKGLLPCVILICTTSHWQTFCSDKQCRFCKTDFPFLIS